MSNETAVKPKKKGKIMWAFIYVTAFAAAFIGGMASKMIKPSWSENYTADWSDSVGIIYTDISYGEKDSNKFDLYVPADNSKEKYKLVVYLHAGGFTSGDKADDAEMLKWLCSKGYVAAGINYTLFSDRNPDANIYTQSTELRESMPVVIGEAKKLGYSIDEMAISGGSAGHCLAMLYAYRDAETSPVPVKMLFGAVGPSCFYPEDWSGYGFDRNTDESNAAAAALFGQMSGKEITPDMFGTYAYDEALKDISALYWVNGDTVPSLLAYGKHDKVQGFGGSVKLDRALTENNVPHDYIVFEHSGHGLQNDSAKMREYYQKIEEYLNKYLPV